MGSSWYGNNGLIYRVSLKSVKALLGTFNKEKALVGACSDFCENSVKFRSQPFYLLVRFTCPAEFRSHQRAGWCLRCHVSYISHNIYPSMEFVKLCKMQWVIWIWHFTTSTDLNTGLNCLLFTARQYINNFGSVTGLYSSLIANGSQLVLFKV